MRDDDDDDKVEVSQQTLDLLDELLVGPVPLDGLPEGWDIGDVDKLQAVGFAKTFEAAAWITPEGIDHRQRPPPLKLPRAKPEPQVPTWGSRWRQLELWGWEGRRRLIMMIEHTRRRT